MPVFYSNRPVAARWQRGGIRNREAPAGILDAARTPLSFKKKLKFWMPPGVGSNLASRNKPFADRLSGGGWAVAGRWPGDGRYNPTATGLPPNCHRPKSWLRLTHISSFRNRMPPPGARRVAFYWLLLMTTLTDLEKIARWHLTLEIGWFF